MKRDDNRSIWKFPLEVTDRQTIQVPKGAQFLAVQVQDGVPCVWMHVTTDAPEVPVVFYVVGTGHAFPVEIDLANYLGTFQLKGGELVFHVFWKWA